MPRTRVTTKEIWSFGELSERAKEKARDWYREGAFDYDWYDYTYEDARTCAELMGIDIATRSENWANTSTGKSGTTKRDCIYFSGFSSQGDGACFEGTIRPRADAVASLATHASNDERLAAIAAELAAIHELTRGLIVAVVRHSGSYSHEYTMDFDFEYPDEDEDAPLSDAVKDAAEKRLTEACRDFARWIYRTLESEYDYLNSDAAVDESIEANEYEFNEDGTRA